MFVRRYRNRKRKEKENWKNDYFFSLKISLFILRTVFGWRNGCVAMDTRPNFSHHRVCTAESLVPLVGFCLSFEYSWIAVSAVWTHRFVEANVPHSTSGKWRANAPAPSMQTNCRCKLIFVNRFSWNFSIVCSHISATLVSHCGHMNRGTGGCLVSIHNLSKMENFWGRVEFAEWMQSI